MFVQRKGRVSIHLGICGVLASAAAAAAHPAAAYPAIAAAPGRAFAAVACPGKAFAVAYQAAAYQGTGTAVN